MHLCCFQRGGVLLEKVPYRRVGMNIFWNYTLEFVSVGFYGERKTRGPGETPFEQGQKSVVDSTQLWCQEGEHSHHVPSPLPINSTVKWSYLYRLASRKMAGFDAVWMKKFPYWPFCNFFLTCWGKMPIQNKAKVSASKLAKTSWFILLPCYECLMHDTAWHSDMSCVPIEDAQKK